MNKLYFFLIHIICILLLFNNTWVNAQDTTQNDLLFFAEKKFSSEYKKKYKEAKALFTYAYYNYSLDLYNEILVEYPAHLECLTYASRATLNILHERKEKEEINLYQVKEYNKMADRALNYCDDALHIINEYYLIKYERKKKKKLKFELKKSELDNMLEELQRLKGEFQDQEKSLELKEDSE